MKDTPYIVRSITARMRNMSVCRMDIRKKKLIEAVADKATYYFAYHYGEGDSYLYSYFYSYPADKLQACLEREHVSVNSNGRKYELYLNFKEGAIYRSDTCAKLILPLVPCSAEKTVYFDEFRSDYYELLRGRQSRNQSKKISVVQSKD